MNGVSLSNQVIHWNESNAASPRNVLGLISGCITKKSFSVGMSNLAS